MPNSLDREAFEAWATSEDYSLQRRDTGEYRFVSTANAWLGWQAGAAAERERTITVPDQMQDWKGMDGAIAFHLIERHANGWDDASKMMHEWLEANRDRSAP